MPTDLHRNREMRTKLCIYSAANLQRNHNYPDSRAEAQCNSAKRDHNKGYCIVISVSNIKLY